jgi:hypothetical protein
MGSLWVRMFRQGAALTDMLRHRKCRDLGGRGIARQLAAPSGTRACDLQSSAEGFVSVASATHMPCNLRFLPMKAGHSGPTESWMGS